MTDEMFARSRLALHAIAEQVLAGPQYRASGTIRLRVVDGGFATVAAPDIVVHGTEVIAGSTRVAIADQTPRAIAAAVGVDDVGPAGIYGDGSGIDADEPLAIDPHAVRQLVSAYARGAAALRRFAADVEPVLWPEHFDLGVRVDDVNYGISPGDGYLDRPYVYVGVDRLPDDPFWNAPFGAARSLAELTTDDDLDDFLQSGRDSWNRYVR